MTGKHSKYGNTRVTHAGRSFASKGERDCYTMLQMMEKAHEIDSIECQVSVPLTAGVKLRVDFTCFDLRIGERVYVEYKGFETNEWLIKKKLWKVHGPGRLYIYQGYWPKMKLVGEIIPKS